MFPEPLDELRQPRAKRPSPAMSATYRTTRLAIRLMGRERVLRFHLFWSWLLARLALELAQDQYGDAFRNEVMGVTDQQLRAVCSGAVVVDVGCGAGRLCRRVAPWAREVIGVDYDSVRLDVARRTTRADHVTYRLSDATEGLKEASGVDRADVVLAIHVIEHFTEPEAFLQELHDFAGSVVLEVPDFAADPLNAARWHENVRWYSDADHVREYTKESLAVLVEGAGWMMDTVNRRGGTLVAILKKSAA